MLRKFAALISMSVLLSCVGCEKRARFERASICARTGATCDDINGNAPALHRCSPQA